MQIGIRRLMMQRAPLAYGKRLVSLCFLTGVFACLYDRLHAILRETVRSAAHPLLPSEEKLALFNEKWRLCDCSLPPV